jgi:hypothetical protein
LSYCNFFLFLFIFKGPEGWGRGKKEPWPESQLFARGKFTPPQKAHYGSYKKI